MVHTHASIRERSIGSGPFGLKGELLQPKEENILASIVNAMDSGRRHRSPPWRGQHARKQARLQQLLADAGLPEDTPSEFPCHRFLRQEPCRAGCSRWHFQRSECSDFLASKGILYFKAAKSLHDLGVQTVNDLGAFFLSEGEAAAHNLGRQWLLCVDGLQSRVGSHVRQTLASFQPTPKPVSQPQTKKHPWNTKKRKAFTQQLEPAPSVREQRLATPDGDEDYRRAAAEELADLAISWAPRAGPARGITDVETLKRKKTSIILRLLAKRFEATSMRRAIRVWEQFGAFCIESS